MIKIENIDVYGWDSAIRGMRNPMNSWNKMDSYFTEHGTSVGENDLKLMKSLFKGGTEHRKYLRFINVTMDITAPLYWWKEFDTYKIGTNCNSCSTMHKILKALRFQKVRKQSAVICSVVVSPLKNSTFLHLLQRLARMRLQIPVWKALNLPTLQPRLTPICSMVVRI